MNLETDLQLHINSWIKNLKNSKSLSVNTVDSYLSDLNLFTTFLNSYRNENTALNHFFVLTKRDIRSWFLYRKNKNDKAKTISRGLSSIKSFIRFLIEDKVIDASEILSMKPPKIEKSLPRPLSIQQINSILETVSVVKQTKWIVKRDKAILVLIYSVGLRITEALSLNKTDIRDSCGFINILGKGSKSRNVPLIEKVKYVILDYLECCDFVDSEALFVNKFGERLSSCSVQKLVKKSRGLLGLSNSVTPHSLRHSCATHLMENSGDLRSIQELLGHSSITSTQIYADVAKKYISDVYDRCHPLSSKKEEE